MTDAQQPTWGPPPPGVQPGASAPPASKGGCLKWGLIIVGILLVFSIGVVSCIAFAAKEVVEELAKASGPAADDDYELRIDTCAVSFKSPRATGTIENTSDKRQGFQIEIRFETADGILIGESSDFVDALEPGQRGQVSVGSLESTEATAVVCEVVGVNYSIFDGESSGSPSSSSGGSK